MLLPFVDTIPAESLSTHWIVSLFSILRFRSLTIIAIVGIPSCRYILLTAPHRFHSHTHICSQGIVIVCIVQCVRNDLTTWNNGHHCFTEFGFCFIKYRKSQYRKYESGIEVVVWWRRNYCTSTKFVRWNFLWTNDWRTNERTNERTNVQTNTKSREVASIIATPLRPTFPTFVSAFSHCNEFH